MKPMIHRYKEQFKVRKCRWSNLKWLIEGVKDGKRSRTFFESKELAQAEADKRNREAWDLLIHGMTPQEFPFELRMDAQRCAELLKPYGATINDATAYYIKFLKAASRSCGAAALVKELLAAKQADGASKAHLRDLRGRLNIFADAFDGKPVSSITTAELDDWLRSLNVAPLTRNHYRRLLILLFNFAIQREYASANPAVKTATAKVIGKPVGILTVSQAEALLRSASTDVLPYIAIGLFAGLRRAEIERLDWSEIDLERNLILVQAEKSKTNQRRFVNIKPCLRAWLMPLRKPNGNVTPELGFRELFNAARSAAGITHWPDNALRHSFASYHLAHFSNAAETALQLGHTNASMTFRHYREAVRPDDAAPYWSILPS